MSGQAVYQQIYQELAQQLDTRVDASSRERIALLVTGIIRAKSAAPAQVAQAIRTLGLSQANADSIERRIRRTENDPELSACTCFHPFARQRLLWGRPNELTLILDPTTQEERVVMLCASIWYRGRALPLAWSVWPGNSPLVGPGFWERVATLLRVVAELLPPGVPVTWLADRAFGTPQFIDLLLPYDWHYVVRVQGQTLCHAAQGRERAVRQLVTPHRTRAKLRGLVFKKHGWRAASVVVYWGRRQRAPLCLVSDLPPCWQLIGRYRRRYPIEATFRNYKSFGWRWEQGQVTDPDHLERLLVAMALASWLTLAIGTQVAAEYLARPASGKRHTVPWEGKRSLFALGMQRLHEAMQGPTPHLCWQLSDWSAPNWQAQNYFHHARAFVFAPVRP